MKGTREFWEMMELFYILIVVVTACIFQNSKNSILKGVNLNHIQYLNKLHLTESHPHNPSPALRRWFFTSLPQTGQSTSWANCLIVSPPSSLNPSVFPNSSLSFLMFKGKKANTSSGAENSFQFGSFCSPYPSSQISSLHRIIPSGPQTTRSQHNPHRFLPRPSAPSRQNILSSYLSKLSPLPYFLTP